MFAIIGLGNPGRRYAQTRHNIGFWILDAFAKRFGIGSWERFSECEIIKGKKDNVDLLLVKPLKYMNLSGQAASEAISFYKVSFTDVIVVHDDLDIEPGYIRIVKGAKSAGHRGVDDIQQVFNSTDFIRVRVGIGHPRNTAAYAGYDVTDWVLGVPSIEEKGRLVEGCRCAELAIETIISMGLGVAQNRYNRRKDLVDGE